MTATFLDGYDAMIDALTADLDALGAGERARLHVYLIEPGASTDRVIAAVTRAVGRGAGVEVRADATVASRFARLVERTRTELPRLHRLARGLGRGAGAAADPLAGRLRVRGVRTPDHAKYAWFARGERSSAYVLTANLGDRFRGWIDHGVRFEGDGAAAALARATAADGDGGRAGGRFDPEALLSQGGAELRLLTDAPRRGRYEVAAGFAALLGAAPLVRYRIAIAYIDRVGAGLLALALGRGATVDLLLPRRANVYHHLDQRTLGELLAAWPGRLRAWLTPAMLHAKTILAETADGARLAWIGSPNLRRNSMRLFAELSAVTAHPEVTAPLARSLDRLEAASGPPVDAALPFRCWRAWIDERLG